MRSPESSPESFEFFPAFKCPTQTTQELVNFLDTQDTSHPFQFPQWNGEDSYLAILRQDSKVCWFAQCGYFYPAGRMIRPIRVLTVNRGPISDNLGIMESGLANLARRAKNEGFTRIEITPEWNGDFAIAAQMMLARQAWTPIGASRTSLRLDLAPAPSELLASFRKSTRYEIRRSEACNIRVRMAQDACECDEWQRLYVEMTKEKGFAPENPIHIRKILRWLVDEPDRGGLLFARDKSRLLGGVVIVRAANRCWYVFGATSKKQTFSVGQLLQWEAIKWAKEKGCLEYDFSGYRENETSGPAFFKRGFCDNVVTFFPTYRYVVSTKRDRVIRIFGRLRRAILHK